MTDSPVSGSSPEGADRSLVPASDLQSDWWYRENEFRNPDLVLSCHVDVDGELDEDAFARAVRALTGRHEALRTHFAEHNGTPHQVIDRQGSVTAWTEDFTAMPPQEARQRAEEVVERERCHDFRLDRPPLVRIGAVKITAGEFVVSLTLHHIVADGWGMGVLLRDLSHLYAAARAGDGGPADLPAAPQLREWSKDEREWNAGAEAAVQREHWRTALKDTRALRVACDREPATPMHYTHAFHEDETGTELRTALEKASRRHRATVSVVCMAAFFEVLAERCGRRDVAAITIFHQRGSSDVENLVGCVMNAATIGVTLPEDAADTRGAVRRTRDAMLAAHANQRLFIGRVWEDSHLGPGSVDALFIFDSGAPPVETFGGHTARQHVYTHPRRYERTGPWWENLKLRVWDAGDRLGLTFEYNADLYDAETVQALAADYRRVLERFAA